MNITLTPAQVALIQQQIHAGHFETVHQAIATALELLDKQMQYDRWVEATQQEIDQAADQLDRGEGVDGEDAIAQLNPSSAPSPSLVYAIEQRFAAFSDLELPNVSREPLRAVIDFWDE